MKLVVETVLAADERHAPSKRHVAASLACAHKCTERFGIVNVAPREIIEERDTGWVRTDCNYVANSFVNRVNGHAVGVNPVE